MVRLFSVGVVQRQRWTFLRGARERAVLLVCRYNVQLLLTSTIHAFGVLERRISPTGVGWIVIRGAKARDCVVYNFHLTRQCSFSTQITDLS